MAMAAPSPRSLLWAGLSGLLAVPGGAGEESILSACLHAVRSSVRSARELEGQRFATSDFVVFLAVLYNNCFSFFLSFPVLYVRRGRWGGGAGRKERGRVCFVECCCLFLFSFL